MALNRFVGDLETEEELSERQLQGIAKQVDDFIKVIASDEIEGRNLQVTFSHGHVHTSNDDRSCQTCVLLARDGRE